jgi:arylformamidase
VPGTRVHAWVGDGERPEFVRQTTLIANVWTGLGADMAQTIEPRRNHFTILDGLTHPGSGLVEAIAGETWP